MGRGRPQLARTEIAIYVQELRDKFGVESTAEKLRVTPRTVYYWWEMHCDPRQRNKRRLLRLYNYHMRNHAGDHRKPAERKQG